MYESMPKERYFRYKTCNGCGKSVKFYRLLSKTRRIPGEVKFRKEVWSISKHMYDENKICNRSNKRFIVRDSEDLRY
jgi:hypothetical protein